MGLYGNTFANGPFFSVVNEAYFGKSEVMLKMEEQIGKIRESYSRYKDNTASKEVQEFNRLMEQQFGMEVFALHVIPSDMKNARTFPIAARFDEFLKNDIGKKIKIDNKKGYYFAKDNGFCIICAVYAGLLTDPTITNGEILGIILHEIGHNFADAVSNTIKVYNRIIVGCSLIAQIIFIISSGLSLLPITILIDKENTNFEAKSNEVGRTEHRIGAYFQGILYKFSDISFNILEFFDRFTFSTGSKIYKLLAKIRLLFARDSIHVPKQNEILADKFATINGYGPEIQSALSKMTHDPSAAEKAIEKIPVVGPLMNLSYAKTTSDSFKYDEYPHLVQRINSSIDVLEYELKKKGLDPKLEKTIKSQVDELKKLRDKISEVDKDSTKAAKFKAGYNALVNNKLPEAITKEIEEKINKELDEYINS